MIAKEILIKLPAGARALHFAMNNHRVQESGWVHSFVRDFPKPELQKWDTAVPVLSACAFLKVWFKDHLPNSVYYKGGFSDADVLTATSRDFIKKIIQEKVRDLIKAGATVPENHPFQAIINDTIMALDHAMLLVTALENGELVNWNTLEIQVRERVYA